MPRKKRGRASTKLVGEITRLSSDEGDFVVLEPKGKAPSPLSFTRQKAPPGTPELAPIKGREWKRKPGAEPAVPEWAPIPGKEWKRKPKKKPSKAPQVLKPTKKKKKPKKTAQTAKRKASMLASLMSRARSARGQAPGRRVRRVIS